eukprot:g29841.t1
MWMKMRCYLIAVCIAGLTRLTHTISQCIPVDMNNLREELSQGKPPPERRIAEMLENIQRLAKVKDIGENEKILIFRAVAKMSSKILGPLSTRVDAAGILAYFDSPNFGEALKPITHELAQIYYTLTMEGDGYASATLLMERWSSNLDNLKEEPQVGYSYILSAMLYGIDVETVKLGALTDATERCLAKLFDVIGALMALPDSGDLVQDIVEGHDFRGQLLKYMTCVLDDDSRSKPIALAGALRMALQILRAYQTRQERVGVSRPEETKVDGPGEAITSQVIVALREMRALVDSLSMSGVNFTNLWQACVQNENESLYPKPRELTQPLVLENFEAIVKLVTFFSQQDTPLLGPPSSGVDLSRHVVHRGVHRLAMFPSLLRRSTAVGYIARAKAHGAQSLLGPFQSTGERFDHLLRGMDCVKVEDGHVECQIPITEALQNSYGTLHGGCTATIVDVYGNFRWFQDATRPGVSVEMSQSFLAPAKGGEVIVARGEVRLFDAKGKLLATGKHTKAFPS